MTAIAENTGKASELLSSGCVKVTRTDGWSTVALIRGGRSIIKVVYSSGRWACEACHGAGCSHTRAVALCTRHL
jgi:hypothetical protein